MEKGVQGCLRLGELGKEGGGRGEGRGERKEGRGNWNTPSPGRDIQVKN